MKLLRNSKILLMVLVPALTLGIGAGFSNFFFGNTALTSSSVDPSIENIRDNFHFDEIENDTNLFNTKFYDVTFYSQAISNGREFYDGRNGYHKELGYFALTSEQFRTLQSLGAELYQISNNAPEQVTDPDLVDIKITVSSETQTYYLYVVNHITFAKISTIAPEIASALINPLCDLFDTHYGDNPQSLYPLKFATWTFTSFTKIYDGLVMSSDKPIYVDGYFPSNIADIPNFNLLLSEQPGLAETDVDSLSIYPVFSTGKDYTDQPVTQDSISISETTSREDSTSNSQKTNLLSTDLNAFVADDLSQVILEGAIDDDTTDNRALSAYRFAGLEVYSDETSLYINNDIDRHNDSWTGDSLRLQDSDHYMDWMFYNAYIDFDLTNSPNEDRASLTLSKGRYNLYLFVKERWNSAGEEGGWRSDCASPFNNNEYNFSENEESNILYALKQNGIEAYRYCSFGASTLYTCSYEEYSGWTAWAWPHNDDFYATNGQRYMYSRKRFDYRDYFLVVEKMYSPKLLGGTNSWDYDAETSSNPLFLQSSEHQNAYETRNISLSEDVTHTYEIVDQETGYSYDLSLPGTCFSIGLSSNKTAVNLPVVTYGDEGMPATVDGEEFKEATIDDFGTITDQGSGNLPIIVIKDRTTNKFRADYYFSKNSGSPHDGLRTISEVINSSSQDDKNLLDSISVRGDYSGSLSSALNGGIGNIRELLESTNILVAPHAGQYNIYLQYEFEDVGSEPVVDVYAYRIKDLTVQIFDPGDLNGDATIDGRDLVYRADGFVLTQNGNYVAYQKEYWSQGNSSSGQSSYWLWTILEDSGLEPNLTVDYIWSATDFVSGDPLEQETEFSNGSQDPESLSQMMDKLWSEGKTLIDITSGEYVTPYVVKNGGFVVTKSTILLAIYRPENYEEYGDLFKGYGESTSQEASL